MSPLPRTYFYAKIIAAVRRDCRRCREVSGQSCRVLGVSGPVGTPIAPVGSGSTGVSPYPLPLGPLPPLGPVGVPDV